MSLSTQASVSTGLATQKFLRVLIKNSLGFIIAKFATDPVIGVAEVILADNGVAVIRIEDKILLEDTCPELPAGCGS